MSPQLRRTAAAAREMLIDLAAETWKAERTELTIADGAVVRTKTKETLPYGKLTQGRSSRRPSPTRPQPRPPMMDRRRPLRAEGQRPRVRHR